MKSSGNTWSPVETHEVQWKHKKSSGNTWSPVETHEVQWKHTKSSGNTRNPAKAHVIAWKHKIPSEKSVSRRAVSRQKTTSHTQYRKLTYVGLGASRNPTQYWSAGSQAPAWEPRKRSSSFARQEARASGFEFPSWSLGTSGLSRWNSRLNPFLIRALVLRWDR